MESIIRLLEKSDIPVIHKNFIDQGWQKDISVLNRYYEDQVNGIRKVVVAVYKNEVLGYATLLFNDNHGPFMDMNLPVVNDFNVFEKYQNNGIGSAIMEAIEEEAKLVSNYITLGVGLHRGYGPAQKMYIKRGYVPDGSGVWYENENLTPYSDCNNNDDLVLYMIKKFNI